ncbi:hypothetical protein AJ78_05952 [Emergomyces pasteurianus Ep9510]|uniref:Auxiliary Activity family 9 catalytic domain-containing protein n=1 Tax=Emergomyces pasteurianus Ep9510 TaxID=1447872 RepID=A0A1J9PAQ7_9EURO|nr:hypothetical protein AJ78_05952 [Emergomyces pasteurianus Ep9510]
MFILRPTTLIGTLAPIAFVNAHGTVTGILADGNYFGGYLIEEYPYIDNPPEVAGWSTTATDTGYVDASSYTSPNIICHRDAQPGAATAEVSAGGTIELQWTKWPEGHHGPVLDYLANCNGDCSKVDKTALEFFKIQEAGLVDGSQTPGIWASDDLTANNNTWKLTIPKTIASGNYVLRHEIIALHSAHEKNGAQNYPQCFNLKITGGGTAQPHGTPGTALYKSTDPGIKMNIYNPFNGYEIPGPPLFKDDGNSGSDQSPRPTNPPPSSPAAPIVSPTAAPPPTTTHSGQDGGPSKPAATGRCSARYNKRSGKSHPREFKHRGSG